MWPGSEISTIRGDLVKFLSRGEASPLLALRVVFHDVGLVRPLGAPVAGLLEPRRGDYRAERLGGSDVDLGMREVGQAADVVQVEVRDHDVANIVAAEAELFDLVGGGFLGAEDGFEEAA